MTHNKLIAGVSLMVAVAALVVHFACPGGWAGVLATTSRLMSAESFVAIPVWLLSVLWVAILTALGAALLLAIHRRQSIVVESPTVTKADIFGLRWRWNYDAGVISELTSYCPKCDQPVSARSENRHGYLQLISYQCDCRKWRSKSFQCSQAEMIDRVKHVIAQKTATPAAGQRRGQATS